MEFGSILFVLAIVFGFYMAWSIGANDVANAMGTSVGSKALTIKRAVILAAIMEFSGAFFVGSHVSETVQKGIVSPEIFSSNPVFFVYGMLAALLSAAIWLQVASYFGWPVSTTHSIVGSIIGFGILIGGVDAIHWQKVGSIVGSWVISPVLSGTIAFVIFSILRKQIYYNADPVSAAKRITPYLVFLVFFVMTLVLVFKGLKNLHLDLPLGSALLIAAAVGIIASIISFFLVKRIKETPEPDRVRLFQPVSVADNVKKASRFLQAAKLDSSGDINEMLSKLLSDLKAIRSRVKTGVTIERGSTEYRTVERIFVYLQIMSAAFVAFAHGANDVANAVGPLSAVINVLMNGSITTQSAVPTWVLILGGVGIVVGLATWGWRVIETIGKKITELTPTRGFSAEFGAAITIVFASKLGLPISTTHALVGAILGVGLARGIGALNMRSIRDIILSWIITIPVGAFGAILFFYILKSIFY